MAKYTALIDRGQKICATALKRGADAAEIYLEKSSSTGYSIENNAIVSSSAGKDFGIGIRVLKNKKLGFAYCTKASDAGMAIERALSATAFSPQSAFAFPKPQKMIDIPGLYDAGVEKITPERGLDMAEALVTAAQSVDAQIAVTDGGIGYGTSSYAIVNSEGVAAGADGSGVSGSVSTILKDGGSISSGFEYAISNANTVDCTDVGTKAAKLARYSHNPQPLLDSSKPMAVVFTPNAFAELLSFTVIPSFYGERAQKGESVYTGKLDKKVASEFLNIHEDPTRPHGTNSSPCDDEGVATRKRAIIEDGVLKRFLYDTYTAHKYKATSTASAFRSGFKTPPSVSAQQLVISGKTTKTDEIVKNIKNGILVYSLLGAHTSNIVTGDFSVNSSLLFRIEKGEVTYPIKHAMLSGNLPALLKKCTAIGTDIRDVPGSLAAEHIITPSVRINGVQITG